ncbi:MAG: hypothetical protein ACXWWR_07285, partial [Candidatus Limnocylindrales bacterium]
MRGVRSAPRRPRSGRIALIVLLVVTLSSCAAPAPSLMTTASPSGQGIVAEVATYRLVANQPGRLLVALLTADNRWLSFGSVGVSFSYLGDQGGTPSPDAVAADATARFLPIPGSPEGDGRPPTLTFPADGRGVYAVEPISFPKAGYWQVVAHGQLGDGSPFNAAAAFTVLDTPSVITVGALAPHTHNPVMGEPGVSAQSIDSRAAGGEPIPDPELH